MKRGTRQVAASLAMFLLAGCAVVGSPPPPRGAPHAAPDPTASDPATLARPQEPPAVAGAAPEGGHLALGRARPQVRTLQIDLETLPVATWTAAPDRAGFWLAPRGDGYLFMLRRPLLAEIVVAGVPRSPDRKPNSDENIGHTAFATFTGASFARGDAPPCGPGHVGILPARWAGFAPKGWTDSGVDVELADADYQRATCTATTRLIAKTRARAILPGFAYAMRLKVDFAGESPDERLVVFLPAGQMVSTSGDPDFLLNDADVGPFTRLSLPLAPGRASAAAVRVSLGAVRMWRRLRAGQRPQAEADESSPQEDLLITVDAVWQGDKRTAMVSIAFPKGSNPKAYGKGIAN